ncbi:MAG: hexitol phosphatase HxpB [Deltaproteobacteria bacterium]
MVKAVIYDMDGLIIDSEPLWQEAEISVFKSLKINLSKEDCMKVMGMRTDEVVDYWFRRFPWEGPSRTEITSDIIRELIGLIKEKGELMEGVKESLDFVRSKGVKTALASSSSYEIINTVLEKFGLMKEFEKIYSAQEEEYGKPHPAVYISAAKRLNVAPVECLAIEDSFNGVLAAKAAKMKCIAIPYEGVRHDRRFAIADVSLDSLMQIDLDVWRRVED